MNWTLLVAFVFTTSFTARVSDDSKLEKILSSKIDFQSDRGSLGSFMQALEDKVKATNKGFKITVLAKDLQNEGITRNQRIGRLNLKGTTVEKVLTKILIEANPRTDAESASDKKQILVWGIGSDSKDDEQSVVWVTTREGAKKRDLKLGSAFVQKK